MPELVATRDAYGRALIKLGKVNSSVVVLDADTSSSTRTSWFAKEFPERFFNFGVAEENMVAVSAGLAACGKIPFVSSFAVFATAKAYDQIRVSVASCGLPVKIVATHAGISVGEDGSSHQSIEDIALMRVLPNMTVIVPADAYETEKAVFEATKVEGPVYIRLGRAKFPLIYEEPYEFKIGRASVLKQGKEATIIACGLMVFEAKKAAEELAKRGVEVGVINMSTIKPIDKEAIIQAAFETGALVTAEEHSIIGGLGGAVAEIMSEEYPVPLKRVGIFDSFGISGSASELLERFGLTSLNIVEAVLEVIKRKK